MKPGSDKKLRIGFGVLFVLLLGGLVIEFREPTAQGRPLTNWLEQINKGDHVEESLAAILSIGPRSLPQLSRQIQQQEPWLHQRIRLFLDTHKLLNLNLKLREPVDLRMASIYAMAPFGKSAAPFLGKIALDQPYTEGIVYGLGYLGSAAEDFLIRACKSPDMNVRIAAAFVLGKIEYEHGPPGFWQWTHSGNKFAMTYGYHIDHVEDITQFLKKNSNEAVRKAGEEWAKYAKTLTLEAQAQAEAERAAFKRAAFERQKAFESETP